MSCSINNCKTPTEAGKYYLGMADQFTPNDLYHLTKDGGGSMIFLY